MTRKIKPKLEIVDGKHTILSPVFEVNGAKVRVRATIGSLKVNPFGDKPIYIPPTNAELAGWLGEKVETSKERTWGGSFGFRPTPHKETTNG